MFQKTLLSVQADLTQYLEDIHKSEYSSLCERSELVATVCLDCVSACLQADSRNEILGVCCHDLDQSALVRAAKELDGDA